MAPTEGLFRNALSPLTKLQKRPLTSPLPAKLGEVGASVASSGRGCDLGFGPRRLLLCSSPSRMSLMAPFDLPFGKCRSGVSPREATHGQSDWLNLLCESMRDGVGKTDLSVVLALVRYRSYA